MIALTTSCLRLISDDCSARFTTGIKSGKTPTLNHLAPALHPKPHTTTSIGVSIRGNLVDIDALKKVPS